MSSHYYPQAIFARALQQFAIKCAILTFVASLTGCASQSRQPLTGRESSRPETPSASRPSQQTQSGSASYIGDEFEGKRTASGETYEQSKLVAAHPSYPLGTVVRVTNLGNGRMVEVRVIDRMAAAAQGADEIVIDVSRGAAEQLGFTLEGKVHVRTEVMEWGGERPEK